MKKVFCISVISVLVFAGSFCWAGEPTYIHGKNIFIETGVTPPDRIPTWYAPMVDKPYAPVFEILATRATYS